MRKISPGFLITGLALLVVALLLFVYFITYRPEQQHPEFEAQIDNPASVPITANDQSRVQTLKVDQSSRPPKRQFHHAAEIGQTPAPDAAPQAVEKKPGILRRFLRFIKRLFRGGRKKGSTNYPFLPNIQASTPSVMRPCRAGTSSPSCEPSKSEEVQLTAIISETEKNRLRYEWSVTGGRIKGDGYSVTWDMSGLFPGAYTALLSAYSGSTRIDRTVSVTVSDCPDCRPSVLCPNVSVSSPDFVAQGREIKFVASVASAIPGIIYNWTVSNGTIVSGNGTSTITVDSSSVGEGSITATVSLGGVDPVCAGTTARSTTSVHLHDPRSVRLFSEFGYIDYMEEEARLDRFADELLKNPANKGIVIVYGHCLGLSEWYAENAKSHLVTQRGIQSDRIVTIDGGCREEKLIQLWVVPPGAAFPSPNTRGIIPCEPCKKRPPRYRNGDHPTDVHPTAVVTGRVTDVNGNSLSDATVTLIGAGKFRREFKTSHNGVFEFREIPAGRYTLEITTPGLGLRRIENLEVKEGVNVLPEPIQVFEKEITTRFKLRDVIRIGYPDHLLESPPGEITFDWDRELRETEVVTSQTTTHGRINIVDRPPPVPGGTPEVPVTQAHGRQYTAFAKVTLIADGLTVVSPPNAEQSLAPSHVRWSWKVKPADMNAAIASFRFHIDLVWRGEGLKEQTYNYDWPTKFAAKIGPPTSVTAAKYGSSTFAFFGVVTIGFGLRRRRLLAALPDEVDALPAGPGVADVAQAEVAEDVSSSVFAPRRAACGEGFLVQVFAHLSGEDPAALIGRATEAEPRAEKVGGDLLEQQIKRETTLTFTLSMKGLEIDQPQQERVWRGRTIAVQFGVTVPKDFEPGSIFSLLVVSADRFPIGHFRFAFEVVKPGGYRAETPNYIGALTRYQHAFISYAHQDRPEVLKRVQMLSLLKEKFFQDFISLEPGMPWEPAIREAIDRSDVIFLFWSSAASASTEVRKEILYAIARRAGDENAAPAIHPVVIEGPPPPAPPPELTFLHFDDKFSYWIFAAQAAAQNEANE